MRAFQRCVLETRIRCAPSLLMTTAIVDKLDNPTLKKGRSRGRINALAAAVIACGFAALAPPRLERRPLARPGARPLALATSAAALVAWKVDHIMPLRDGGDPLDEANLQALCRPCHFRKSHAESETQVFRPRRLAQGLAAPHHRRPTTLLRRPRRSEFRPVAARREERCMDFRASNVTVTANKYRQSILQERPACHLYRP